MFVKRRLNKFQIFSYSYFLLLFPVTYSSTNAIFLNTRTRPTHVNRNLRVVRYGSISVRYVGTRCVGTASSSETVRNIAVKYHVDEQVSLGPTPARRESQQGGEPRKSE
uniref:Putative secreted protein n=1 Tax=Ixodes ricinus TaxID=34613 RepID=A0A6B0UH44_IXORI